MSGTWNAAYCYGYQYDEKARLFPQSARFEAGVFLMNRWWFITFALLLAVASSAAGQQDVGGEAAPDSIPADSLQTDSLRADTLAADSTDMRLRLGLKPLDLPVAVALPPPPGADAFYLRPRTTDWSGEWSDSAHAALESQRSDLWLAARAADVETAPDTVAYLPPPPAPDTMRESVLPGVAGRYADLGIAVDGRAEMGSSWARFEPCDPTLTLGCNRGLIPQIQPEVQFGVRVGGTIADRIHVNVDYDQSREFDAANNINVYYQGLEDEILQRLEVGDVSIDLPASQFVTSGIPAGNFGFKATGQLGPIDFQAVWAEQKGDISTEERQLDTGGGSQGVVQQFEITFDDADYTTGQFFFLVHPDSIQGSPRIDIRRLTTADAPTSLRPADGELQLYRTDQISPRNANVGYFLGHAVSADSSQQYSGQFQRLIPGEDYQLHSSGLWVMLSNPLQRNQILAASYVTVSGDTVGTLDAGGQAGGGTSDDPPPLRLLRGPTVGHHPGQSTWDYEMHHVYRLNASSDVVTSSIDLEISLGQLSAGITYRDVAGQRLPLLQFFGLDEVGPYQQIDEAYIFQPSSESLGGSGTSGNTDINGTFIIFPVLEPFAEPYGSPRAGVSAQQALTALGTDANTAIYQEEDPVERQNSGRFRMHFSYEIHTEGLISTFNLGAFGIREGSETLWLDDRELVRGQDYTINYEVGSVTLTNPQQLFATNPDPQIRATFEKKAIFQTVPTSVFGVSTEYDLGDRGFLNFMGLYQKEKAIRRRPQLGIEPGAILLGGVSGQLNLGGGWMDRALDAIPLLRTSGTSDITLSGELALSMPDPNILDATYLDDFEGANEVNVFLDAPAWQLGSKPSGTTGATEIMPVVLNTSTAEKLVWQSKYLEGGQVRGGAAPQEIDQQIRVGGRGARNTVLSLIFGDTVTGGGNGWRSVTTVLSTQGIDLTRSEHLEFYAALPSGVDDMALVIDIGTVGEDAYYIAPDGRLTGSYPDGERWGLGILDEEASAAQQEIWTNAKDARGLWNQPCQGQRGAAYSFGDPRANCTVGNGLVDSEDLDGDGVLDNLGADGAYYRYVVPLSDPNQYMVRDTAGTGTSFRLFRIPLQGPNAISVNGASNAIWRFIKHLRITVTGNPSRATQIALSRMRIVGSRWTKRNLDGVVTGRTGSQPGAASTRVRVGPVSRITDGAEYSSPPGVRAELQDPSAQFGIGGTQFNESGLRIEYEALAPDERAAVYFRFGQDARNLLSYRQIRLWAAPRTGDWAKNGAERLVVKIGTDEDNFYLYQSPLGPPAGSAVAPSEWRELTLDFGQWFSLRAEAEKLLIQRDSAAGSDPIMLWSEDSTYAVVLQDRARAPNLSAVRELSFAVYNSGGRPVTGEVWLNDMRLSGEVTDAGYAGRVDLDMNAGSFASANVSFVNENPLFRQLNEDASYLSNHTLNFTGGAQLGQFLPSGWGVALPVNVSHTRSAQDPTFLARSDVRATELDGLRETGDRATRIGISLSKRTPTSNPWLSLLVDGVSLRFGYNTAERNGINSRNLSEGINASFSYNRQLAPRTFDITPGFIETVLGWLTPEGMEDSQVFQRVTDAEFQWTPANISFSSSYNDQSGRTYRYDEILQLPSDDDVEPVRSAREGLENSARVSFRPFTSLTADFSVTSSRDLLPAARATEQKAARRAIRRVRGEIGGVDIGWETNRTVNSRVSFSPEIVPWLRPTFSYTGTFGLQRNATQLGTKVVAGDSVPVMQRNLNANRSIQQSLTLEPAGMFQGLFGANPAADNFFSRMLFQFGRLIAPISVNRVSGLTSQFDRSTADVGVGYQLGLGDLNEFRLMDGDTAVNATRTRGFNISSGLSLPWQLRLDVEYDRRRSSATKLRGGNVSSRSQRWPALNVSWSRVPLPGFLDNYISNISMATGFTRETSSSNIGNELSESSRGRNIPVRITIGLTNGLSANYSASRSRRTREDQVGVSRDRTLSRTIGLTGSFDAPASLADRLSQPIRASLSYQSTRRRQCRVRPEEIAEAATESCALYSGNINRSVNLTLDTMISDLNLGLQMSWYDNESLVGIGNSQSEFQLRLFGNFNFTAGSFGGNR